MDFQKPRFNNITISSQAEYEALCEKAEIQMQPVKHFAQEETWYMGADYWPEQWAEMTREERCQHVIGVAYIKHLYTRPRPARRAPKPVEVVRCDCGHDVPRRMQMNASMGTSCPRCYDRMSD